MAFSSDMGDGDFSLGSYYGGNGGGSAPIASANMTGSDAGAFDDDEEKKGWFDPSKVGAAQQAQGGNGALYGSYLASVLNPIANPTYWRDPGLDRSAGERSVMTAYNPDMGGVAGGDNSYYQSSNGTKLNSWQQDGNTYFSDTYDNPTGSEHDKANVTYQIGPNGMSTPVTSEKFYDPSGWVSWGRPLTYMAATLATAGALGASGALAGAGGEAGGAAAGTAEGVGASGGGLSSADLAALHSAEGYGAAAYAPATNAALAESAAGTAGYGASSAGAGGGAGGGWSLGGLGTSMGKGALVNGGMTAIRGGNLNDILKGAAYGAVGGGVGYGVGEYNPGSYVTDSTAGQSVVNRGVTGGINAGLSGGNVGQGALMGAGTQAGNVYGGQLYNNYVNSPDTTGGGGDMPEASMTDLSNGYSTGDVSGTPVKDYFQNLNQQSQAPVGFTSSPEVNQSLGNNTDSSLYNPDFNSSGVQQPVSQNSNPFKQMLAQSFGFGGGAAPGGGGTPRFGDMAGSLAGLYSAWQQKKRLADLRGGLQSMFGPNSPYAQQMGQQLARRDAAAGRRSQYGPREVELQARLAEMNSRNAPQIQSLIGGETAARNAMLNNTLRMGQQSGFNGWAGNQLQSYAQPYLNQMFGSPMAQPNVGPSYDDMGPL